MVDQLLKEKGRNSWGHAAKNLAMIVEKPVYVLNLLGTKDLDQETNSPTNGKPIRITMSEVIQPSRERLHP
jgi:hypothetical protein